MRRIRAERCGRAGLEHQAGEGGGTRVGVQAGEKQGRVGEPVDQKIITRGARDSARDDQRRTVSAGAGNGPGLRRAEHKRGTDKDRPSIIGNRDTVRRAGGGDGQRRGEFGTALRDGHAEDTARGGDKLQAADGEVAVEGGDVVRGRGTRGGAEDDFVGDAREALGVRRTQRVRGEVGVEADVIERRPAHVGADTPVEIGREGSRRQGDRGGCIRERKGVSTEGAEFTKRVGRATQAAGGGDQVVGSGRQAGEASQADDDLVGGDGRRGRSDAVVGREGPNVEAEGGRARGAGPEVEDARAEVDRLADGVVQVQDRAGVDLDGRSKEGGGPASGDIEATFEDGGLTDVGKRRPRKRQGADAFLDQAEVVLVRTAATDGPSIQAGDVLVDREVGDARGAADNPTAGDRAQGAHEDRGTRAAAARDGNGLRETWTIAAAVQNGDAGDDSVGDGGRKLGSLRALETPDCADADDRRGGET